MGGELRVAVVGDAVGGGGRLRAVGEQGEPLGPVEVVAELAAEVRRREAERHPRWVWAATDERAADQAFNINNGDLFRWKEMWPKIAAYFELEAAPPLPMSLAATMADKEPLWRQMVVEHGLADHSYAEVSSWAFADGVFSWDYDLIADGSKARRLGFHDFVETEAMFRDRFDELRKRRVIP